MLKHLHIQNYSLIEQLDLHLTGGLTVITGETGAGKSILLGAISLLLGQRADSKSLFDASKKCIIEGQFSLSAYPHLEAIFAEDDVPADQQDFIKINAEMSKIWPVISSRKGPLPDADSFNGKPNKRDLLEK